ncbi:MAG: AGE family epimerase/isomerase [Sphaerochaeta sp.]|jgi:N-acylglucosamine 2-epimerase|uniref:AGE family epimerase/isomerase n=1 Tax=Sphaerochaeta sp. TaxID=1972642 RepID=UPI003D0DCB33
MEKMLEFYRCHLKQQILPFWEQAFDDTFAGVFTCFSNDGSRLVSTDKYTWSQARMLWCLSYLLSSHACSKGIEQPRLDALGRQAHRLYSFLHEHVFLPGDLEVCAFVLDREGVPKEPVPGQGLYTSFYADCFVIMAFSRYAHLVGASSIAKEALAVYEKLLRVLDAGVVRTEPYALPEGTKAQSVYMILCNTAHELALCLEGFHMQQAAAVRAQATAYAARIMDTFIDVQSMQLCELTGDDAKQSSLLIRHRNPGHALECMWFCMDVLDDRYIERIEKTMKAMLALGWDDQYGGLFRYVDMQGGQVKGLSDGSPFADLVARTWDYKLWWPHAEALYACLRMYVKTGELTFLDWHRRLSAYTFPTFTAPQGKEWIQIRQRDGRPVDTVVALPVKDPYHIFRMLLLSIELLDAHRKDETNDV